MTSHVWTALISASIPTTIHYRSVILAALILTYDRASHLIPDRHRPALFRHHTGGHIQRKAT